MTSALGVSTPRLCSVGLWQVCNGRLASLKCWICLAGAADLQQLQWPDLFCNQDLSWSLADWCNVVTCQVTALLGNKLETCSVCAAWQVGKLKCWFA